MLNKVFLNEDDHIEQQYVGDQTDSVITKTVAQSVALIKQLEAANKPIYVLSDVTQLGKLPTVSRKIAVGNLRTFHYDRIAIYGTNTFTKALINLIVHAAGKHRIIKIFSSREEARQWLLEEVTAK